MPLALAEWHARFEQQAQWTRDVRFYLYRRSGLAQARRVLDLGCGTGVLCAELLSQCSGVTVGLDILYDRLAFAKTLAPVAHFTQGDGLQLPFATASFDVALCHFLLLWVNDPAKIVAEMRRVTRPGGAVLALAEPDYGGRIDYPLELASIGELQRSALQTQGADPLMGRRVRAIFTSAGLAEVEAGVLGGQWHGQRSDEEIKMEWQVLEDDLAGSSEGELQRLKAEEIRAWQECSRILYVPTFYAYGKVGEG